MTTKTRKLSIRLLKDGLKPEESLRDSVKLVDWDILDGAKIALGTSIDKTPGWASFLELSTEQRNKVFSKLAFAIVFLEVSKRWFAITFGMGHVKLDPVNFVQDFGLRVVLNAVDPDLLKSIDTQTPNENTLSRRIQTSRGSNQTAFAIDEELDILRGLAGTPKDLAFASRVAGTDVLSLDRQITITDLPQTCFDAYNMYLQNDYKANFSWIDQVKHIRNDDLKDKLNLKVIEAINRAVEDGNSDELYLAFPKVYDPERTKQLRYRGFRSKKIYPDLEIGDYIEELKKQAKFELTTNDLKKQSIHEVDDKGIDCGDKWKIFDCLVYETTLNDQTYVLSGGRWYQVDKNLMDQVQNFFDTLPQYLMPDAYADENEEKYNARIAKENKNNLLCLDRKLLKPTGAHTKIEVCDFLGDYHLIHVKDKTSSTRLSHLFNQGTVSGYVLKLDNQFRNDVHCLIEKIQKENKQTGFDNMIGAATSEFDPSKLTVVYAVIGTGNKRLPFFSLITLRRAVQDLRAVGYNVKFSWIAKP